ncbi:hypothetical protein BDF21DRAFT_495483 [Thamnidium elegans]|nr:hypothetical protein BDF21DRAFT_495483 [Thamnidium elegans]
MSPSYHIKLNKDFNQMNEYNRKNPSAVKKNNFIALTDHSQRTSKLLPYISSMQQRKVNEKEFLLNAHSPKNAVISS